MATFNPKRFTRPDRLKTITPHRLINLLSSWANYFKERGVVWPSNKEDPIPYEDIASVLMRPDGGTPEDLVDALYYIDESSSHEAMDRLFEAIEKAKVSIENDGQSSPADLAVQIWLKDPEFLKKQHSEHIAFTRTSFRYYAGQSSFKPENSIPEPPIITADQITVMQDQMNEWFEAHRRGRNCRIFPFPRGTKIWILIRHGDTMVVNGKHQDDGLDKIVYYRPQKHDVVIYDAESDELGINAGTRGERELYMRVLGAQLFGDDDYFDDSDSFTLDPLMDEGPNSMSCSDVPGVDRVQLVEFGRFWGGAGNEIEIRKADDLFKAYGEHWKKRLAGKITYAVFKISFTAEKRKRSVMIRPANIARFERDSDEDTIIKWLKIRGFWRMSAEVMDDAA